MDVCWTSFNCQSAWRSSVCPVLLSVPLIPCLSQPLLLVLHFLYVCMCECLFLTKFVGIFVLCSVTFILCLFFSSLFCAPPLVVLSSSTWCALFTRPFTIVALFAIQNYFYRLSTRRQNCIERKTKKKTEGKLLLCMAKFAENKNTTCGK